MRLDPLLTWSPATGAIRHLTEDLLREIYLAPRPAPNGVVEALAERHAPWSRSFVTAPDATSRAVEAGLTKIMRATHALDPDEVTVAAIPPGRARSHLEALRDLWRDTGFLPSPLDAYRDVLLRDASETLEPLPLLDTTPCPHADPVERAVLRRLAEQHGQAPDAARETWIGRQVPREGSAPGALGLIQSGLGRVKCQTTLDPSLAFYGLRDPREEAEFAAALVQAKLQDGTIERPSEIGVLVPDDDAYGVSLGEAFERLGIPLSGQPAEQAKRDPVGELVTALLAVFEGPAPRTALATIYASRVMPWSRDTGCRMAREIIERGWSRTATEYTEEGREILDALCPVNSSRKLLARFFAIDKALPDLSLAPRIGELKEALADEIDWPLLRRIGAPRPLEATGHDRFVEGVSLFTETALPWRPVRHLVTLGMAGRQWPSIPGSDPFFTESEIALIRQNSGLELRGRREVLARGLDLFRRQLCAATDSATFLIPARNLRGETQPVSTGLALLTHLLGKKEPRDLLIDIRATPRDTWPVASDLAEPPAGRGLPQVPATGRIELGTNLLDWRKDGAGSALPQSPSRLETLLVSPFAWLLGEMDAKDRTWLPERLDVMTLGSLMHLVLEELFPEGKAVPSQQDIDERIVQALDKAIGRYAAWLETAGWSTERANLLREARAMAAAWRRFLVGTGATVIHNEIDLSGNHQGLRISGRADCILKLPSNHILIVDHKRSRSNGRRDRMLKGWDLQVALYRAMLENPFEDSPLTRMIQEGARPVAAYHTLLDGVVLVDAEGKGLRGAEPIDVDISENALAELAVTIADVATGTIQLNRESDLVRFEKERAITPYALKDNVLLTSFLCPDDEGDDA